MTQRGSATSSPDYAAQIYLAGVLGRYYRELQEQADSIVATAKDESRQKALRLKFDWQLSGVNLAASKIILDKTAREQYEAHKAGRR